ncbi:hypothetical protein VT06_15060 [Arsukibacterium sp. MJ3]|jgi:hypothetical protein|uniref:DUF484 family protein n=1 Tax=Arsukibacterium sp. MJ3 TaxID=1632859 RepID=UPI0006273FBD|nr:DUF484 family protein [Arsukibacterium sp. MJ3]KKO47825.1 hypothetical protein VT06_15060 [Arsukibacterium sp. MJ3]
MTDILAQDKDAIATSVVLDYLQDHPEFFQQYPQLLQQMRLPHQQRGSISLVERQQELQRAKIAALEDDITRLMSLARQNEHIFHALNTLHLSLLQHPTLPDAERAVQHFAKSMPQVHACRLVCLQPDSSAISQYQLLLTRRLSSDNVYLGRLNKEEQQPLFADSIHSVALVQIGTGPGLALLAFGSEQDDHFQPAMDRLFIRHLAKLLVLVLPGYDRN